MPETYTPQTWVNGSAGGTPLNATALNRIENGIESMDDRVTFLEDNAVTSTAIDSIVQMTQAAYNSLGTKNSRTLYIIVG